MDNWSFIINGLLAKGWTMTLLGKTVGLSPQAISDIKQGRTKAPCGMAAVRLHELYSKEIEIEVQQGDH